MLVFRAKQEKASNLSILVSHSLVPPSITYILQSPQNRVQGFLGPGHVCTIMGYREYEPIADRYKVPIVITGFEPLDLLEGTLMTVRQLEAGSANVENQYSRVLDRDGNVPARKLVNSIFEVSDRKWRGVGWISKSGCKLRWEYRDHDAAAHRRFPRFTCDWGRFRAWTKTLCSSPILSPLRTLRLHTRVCSLKTSTLACFA
jgi:hydrogenase expression/formation protein HypD